MEEAYKHPVVGHEHHDLPVSLYWIVFGLLIGLTLLTVYVAEFDFGSYAMAVTLLIAGTKSALVLGVFMHLWFDNKFYVVILATTLMFLSLFVLFPMLDEGSRAAVDPVKANFLPRDEFVHKYKIEHKGALPLRPGLREAKRDELIFVEPGEH